MTGRSLGLDFGTTNTVLSWAHPHRPAEPVVFHFLTSLLFSFRSALCFRDDGDEHQPHVVTEAGPWAIQQFIESSHESRFIQSLKSFAASRLFETTGRPVEYAGSRPDPALAMQRYDAALGRFGFERVRQVYEPVAAAFFYAQSLEDSATVLVADFGGGTTDFSVVHFDVGARGLRAEALGHSGVGVAGDRFDYRLIDQVVLPQLGKGSTYRSVGKRLELPRSCFASFAHWHELSVMKGSVDFRELKELLAYSDEPELLRRFIRLVESDQGYTLYKSVSETKEALSREESTKFSFRGPGFEIESVVTRAQFEGWIAGELEAIEAALEQVLVNSSIVDRDVDRVFLTGGSSFVPAVRRIFVKRFGAERVEAGNEFVSIANGLATIGLREDIDSWVVTAEAEKK
jgi:hypothetical chaperone protein